MIALMVKLVTCPILMVIQMSKTCAWERRVVDGADDGTKNRRRHEEQIVIPNTDVSMLVTKNGRRQYHSLD